MSEPLDHLEITEIKAGENPIIHDIPLSDITEDGIVLGRDPNKCYLQIGHFLKDHKRIFDSIGRQHVTIYKLYNDSRESFDYYIRRGYRDSDGNWKTISEETGFDIFIGNQALDRNTSIQLRTGALIDLIESIAGYKIKLYWGIKSNGDPSQPPTIPINEEYVNTLEFENRILKEQKDLNDQQIKRLQVINSRITKFIEIDRREKKQLSDSLKKQIEKDKIQDKKLKNISIFGLIIIGCMIIHLGIDIQEIERILEIGALLSGTGLIYTAATKN